MHLGAGVRGPKLTAAEVLTPEWEDALRGAYDAGAGKGPLDLDDEDLQDAARLASPLADGGILWHPASLEDIYSVPARTLILFDWYRAGMAARLQPWGWWRLAGKRAISHQFTSDWRGRPEPPARCGYQPPEDSDLERSEVGKCSRCEKLDKGISEEPTGTVAGVRVGVQRAS